jgi:hypothetical protein
MNIDSSSLARRVCVGNDVETDEICEQIMTEELDVCRAGMDRATNYLFYWEAYNTIASLKFNNSVACAEDLFAADINELTSEEFDDVEQCAFERIWDADNANIVGDLVYLGEEMTFSEALDMAQSVSYGGTDRFKGGLIDVLIEVYRSYGRHADVDRLTSFRSKLEQL